jgi:hypothetical protein
VTDTPPTAALCLCAGFLGGQKRNGSYYLVFSQVMIYIRQVSFVIGKSAYKHGITNYAIQTCLLNIRRDIVLEEESDKRLLIGFDHNGNSLELIGIMQNDTLYIIHAMKLRRQFYHLLAEAKDD